MRFQLSRFTAPLLICAASARISACDLCAISAAVEARDDKPGLSLGMLVDYSHAATLQQDSAVIADPANQYLDITEIQAVVGWRFNQWVGIRAYVPWFDMHFRRPDQFGLGGTETGSVSGLGDISVEVVGTFWRHIDETSAFLVTGFAGLKLPTGNSDQLALGSNPGSGIHGHDLALGSGSTDEIIGASLFGRWQRLFFTAHSQYDLRHEGDHDYQYANEFMWGGGPGVYAWLGRSSLGVQLNITGRTKGRDEVFGVKLSHSGMTEVYLGPLISYTWENRLSSEVGLDLPVVEKNTGLQVVNEYRLHAGANWRF